MIDYFIENRFPREQEIDEIIELMNKVWGKYYFEEGIWYYDRNLLDAIFKSPRQKDDFYWIVKMKDTNKIIGFALVILWEVKIYGKGPYNMIYGTFITTDSSYQKMGIGTAISKAVTEIFNKYDFMGSLVGFEDKSIAMKTMSEQRHKRMKAIRRSEIAYIRPLNVQKKGKLMDMKWYEKIGARLIQGAKKVSNPNIRSTEIADIDSILDLLNSYSDDTNAIARIWTKQEIRNYICNPLYRGKVYIKNNKVKAIINTYVFSFHSKGVRIKIAIIENSHYEHITLKEQKNLIKALIYDLKLEGVAAATDFAVGYRDLKPLIKNKFIKYPRKLTQYVVARPDLTLNDEPFTFIEKNKGRIYIEVQ